MDTFIDKLAQKRNAQEMIRANSAAEAAGMKKRDIIVKFDGQRISSYADLRGSDLRGRGGQSDRQDTLSVCGGFFLFQPD